LFQNLKSHNKSAQYIAPDTGNDGSMQWRTQEFFSEGVQQIQLRTEDREDGDLGAVTP